MGGIRIRPKYDTKDPLQKSTDGGINHGQWAGQMWVSGFEP